MLDTLSFLQGKLSACERVIVAHCVGLPEWGERRVLRRMIRELEGGGSVVGDGKRVITIPDGVVATRSVKAYRGGYKKDLENSPMRGTQHGRRITDFYDIVESVVRENGGCIDTDVLEDYLHSIHGMEVKYGKQRLKSLIASYINIYNKTNNGGALELWPSKGVGAKSVGRYKEVRLVGWSAAVGDAE